MIVRKRRGSKKHPAAAFGFGAHRIRDVHGIGHREGDVAVEAAKVLEVGVVLAGCEGRVGIGVQLHGKHVLLAGGRQLVRDVIRELRVAALVRAELLAVEPDLGLLHGSPKGDQRAAAVLDGLGVSKCRRYQKTPRSSW